MPLVKIELTKGNSREFLLLLMTTTMNCVQEILNLPSNDRNIRLNEFNPDFFTMKPPYKYIIEISLFSGRTIETKRLLYTTIGEKLKQKLGIEKEEFFILLNEQPKPNWGVRGCIPASDIDLGFNIEI